MDTLFRIIVVLGLIAFAGCGQDDLVGLSDDAPRFTGTVTAAPLAPGVDASGSVVWIETNPPGSGVQVGLVVHSASIIVIRSGRGFVAATGADITVGDDLRVWTTHSEYLSTPPMYDATRIEIW